jgi:hypothetical protein
MKHVYEQALYWYMKRHYSVILNGGMYVQLVELSVLFEAPSPLILNLPITTFSLIFIL